MTLSICPVFVGGVDIHCSKEISHGVHASPAFIRQPVLTSHSCFFGLCQDLSSCCRINPPSAECYSALLLPPRGCFPGAVLLTCPTQLFRICLFYFIYFSNLRIIQNSMQKKVQINRCYKCEHKKMHLCALTLLLRFQRIHCTVSRLQ